MNNKKTVFLLAAVCVLSVLFSGCGSGMKTATIVMSDGTDEPGIGGRKFESFHIADIYRLPESFTRNERILGWSASGGVLAFARERDETGAAMINRIAFPYEQSDTLRRVKPDTTEGVLSPDGRFIAETPSSASRTSSALQIVSLANAQTTAIPTSAMPSPAFIQNFGWSDNGRYLVYLTVDPSGGGDARVGVYEVSSGKARVYRIDGSDEAVEGRTLLSADVSDDGRSVLLTAFKKSRNDDKEVLLGTVRGNAIEIVYTHSIESEHTEWIGSDQFLFLGTEGTLYQYDRRNGALAVLLEKVDSFALSQDESRIAYSLYDQETIYAGKMQGKNVLYNEPVYHGLLPELLTWSPDDSGNLLIYGSKLYASQSYAPGDTEGRQAFVIRFQ
ncbi:WD40 repeat domain-containing protein [Saccharibacillus alkalitolerans]|uniref:WD40 repeat domain-containing protein n=1 Tax=Saccharibacillus alkalitolerans TaxID=2705290 RepID=A0ABX0F2C8_9BACL|nr:hypothetical protein [Saccharibacillus alkalitolerans]NGZ75141.1 hypothetical protein [Saccharibacillus alkalitolerans]